MKFRTLLGHRMLHASRAFALAGYRLSTALFVMRPPLLRVFVEPAVGCQASDLIPSAPQAARSITLSTARTVWCAPPVHGTGLLRVTRNLTDPSKNRTLVLDCMDCPCGWWVVTPPFTTLRWLMGHAPNVLTISPTTEFVWVLPLVSQCTYTAHSPFSGLRGSAATRRGRYSKPTANSAPVSNRA